jgi:hypothetical protein
MTAKRTARPARCQGPHLSNPPPIVDNTSQLFLLFNPKETTMTITLGHLQPIIALIAGVLILIMPRLLNFIVAIYLIAVGLLGLGILR